MNKKSGWVGQSNIGTTTTVRTGKAAAAPITTIGRSNGASTNRKPER